MNEISPAISRDPADQVSVGCAQPVQSKVLAKIDVDNAHALRLCEEIESLEW